MLEVRKGILTPEQEDKIDTALKMKNPLLEAVDGPIIRTVDNILLEKVATILEEKYPTLMGYFYETLDTVIESL